MSDYSDKLKDPALPDCFKSSPFSVPDSSGVYAVCLMDDLKSKELILYIGSSNNIKKRTHTRFHPYLISVDKYFNSLVYLKYYETSDYVNIEKELIHKIQPELNIQHK